MHYVDSLGLGCSFHHRYDSSEFAYEEICYGMYDLAMGGWKRFTLYDSYSTPLISIDTEWARKNYKIDHFTITIVRDKML